MEHQKSVCVKIYLKPILFAEMSDSAEKAGIRRKGLSLYTQKPHGMLDEKLANTDKLAKFFKFLYQYYKETEALRLSRAADLARKEREVADERAKLGIT